MKSRESMVAKQVRLKQWAKQVQSCNNRPTGMTVDECCTQNNITKANYYWRMKQIRIACLDAVEQIRSGICKKNKKFMRVNRIIHYFSSVADKYYKEEVESRDYNNTTKRFFKTVLQRHNVLCFGTGSVYSVPRKDLSVSEQYHSNATAYLEHCRKIGNRPLTINKGKRTVGILEK